jgi:hypothetical protein
VVACRAECAGVMSVCAGHIWAQAASRVYLNSCLVRTDGSQLVLSSQDAMQHQDVALLARAATYMLTLPLTPALRLLLTCTCPHCPPAEV